MLMDIKEKLEAEMARTGYSQYELAKLSTVPQPTIQRILSGETIDPKSLTVKKLSLALDVSSSVLLDDAGISESKASYEMGLTPDAIDLAKRYMKLPRQSQQKIIDYLSFIESANT